MLALTAAKFGVRPSALFALADDAVALDFDQAAAYRLNEWEDKKLCAVWGTGEPVDGS